MAAVAELKAESGQPVVPLDRQFLIHELNVFEESTDNTIPLLYGILAHFLRSPPDGMQNALRTESALQPPNLSLDWQPSGRKPVDDHLGKERQTSAKTEELHSSQAVNR
ncbi:lisH domain-containing protein FOPNL isoform X2 [Nannospalax galili]|uniref:lisH domain-containing protein FOPNL isoform X2 n=1 Tax=Nannospalax galili TaxID=1026970 RepID=UPI00081A179D|nr:lisH domain-containing protein FOPNL isoform X2 [Nannospalax galili]